VTVNVNVRAVSGQHGEFGGGGWGRIAAVKAVHQLGYQPGGLAGGDFSSQIVKIGGAAPQGITGALEALLPFSPASLQAGYHCAHL
jgi:hypothetical protein